MENVDRLHLRNRLLNEGTECFKDEELLEILLGYTSNRKDISMISKRIIKKYGSLANLLESDYEEILMNQGIRKSSAFLLSFIPHFTKRFLRSKWEEKVVVDSSKKAGEFACHLFLDVVYETFYVISLDAQNRIRHTKAVFNGTINEAPVYPRLVLEEALRKRASGIIICHNHPGGSLKPSEQDIAITKKIVKAMALVSIRVVDHIIVADDGFYSFAEQGLM